MVLSTIAIWALPVIVVNGGQGTALYYSTIQFFLHFLFNGWYLFGLMALMLRTLEQREVALSLPRLRWFFYTLVISCFLTYALVVAWSTPQPVIFWVNSLGVLVQLGAAVLLVLLLWPVRRRLVFEAWERRLYAFALVSLLVKIGMQALIAVPAIATVGFTLRNYVIGFIHLVLLGVVTGFLVGYGLQRRLFQSRGRLARLALWLFLAGFVCSEGVLFVQGTLLWARFGFVPGYYEILFGVSALLPVGLALLLAAQYGKVRVERAAEVDSSMLEGSKSE